MLFGEHFPEVLNVRIAGINERFAAVPPDEPKAFVGVSVARNDVVAGLKLFEHPAIEPGQQAEAKGLSRKGFERAAAA